MNRTAVLKKHAKARANERFELKLNNEKLRAVVHQIQDGKAEFVSRSSLARTVWNVTCEGKTCRVVYDKGRKVIVTFLPLKEVSKIKQTNGRIRELKD